MKKTLITASLLLMWLMWLGLNAANYHSILIDKVDGSQLTVIMEDGLTTTFADGNMLLQSTNTNLSIPLDQTKSWTFSTEGGTDPEPDPEYRYNDGKVYRSGRGVNTLQIIVDDDKSAPKSVSGAGTAYGHAVYTDRTSEVIEAKAGSTINIQCISGQGDWMHSMVYVDYNRDGNFKVSLGSMGIPNSDSELVAFNCASITPGSEDKPYYNSLGQSKGDGAMTFVTTGGSEIPSFTIPANLPAGNYRLRYKVDWAYTDADALNEERKGNFITTNGGAIIDMTLSITGSAVSPDGPFSVNAAAAEHGFIALYSDGEFVPNGSKLPIGTNIEVVATPEAGYELETIYVNDVALAKGTTTFALEGNTMVRATFTKPAAPTNGYVSVFVYQPDGQIIKVTIEDGMTTSFAEDAMMIVSTKGIIAIPYAEISYWKFSLEPGDDDRWSGIDEAVADGQNVDVRGNRIEMSNLPDNSHIAVYSIDGRLVKSAEASGSYTLYLSSLTKGIYVVTVNNQSIKISLK